MVGLVCERCPLAFEVGYYGYWDLSGGCVKYICRHCGTMHKIEHLQCQEDILFALDGPIRAMVEEPWVTPDGETQSESHLPVTEDSWRMIGTLPTAIEFLQGWFILPVRAQAVALDRVTCAHCGCVGGLLSREWPLKADGTKPELEDNCPVCGEHLKWLSPYHQLSPETGIGIDVISIPVLRIDSQYRSNVPYTHGPVGG